MPEKKGGDGPGRARRKEDRPAEIIDAALRVFAKRGFAAARLEDVARQAGIAKGTIYLYYESKENLFEAMVRAKVVPVISGAKDMATAFEGPTAALLEAIVRKVYGNMVEDAELRAILRLLIAEGARFPHLTRFYEREILSVGIELLAKVIRRGIERGEFRETPALELPEVLMGPTYMAAVWKMIFDDAKPLEVDRFIDVHLDLVLNGLRAR